MNKERIGKYIKFLRERNNLTQEELAKKVPVTREAVSKWETGRRILNIETLLILSNIFNVSIESLLSGGESDNAMINLYKDNINLHKKVGILLLVTILIIITFLIYYFFNNYNSFKFYNLTGGNDNFILENSVMFVSKEKFFISIPRVSSINNDEINYKKVYYLDNKNEKHLIFEGNSDVLNYSENNGYNESINFKNLYNIIRISIVTTSIIKLNMMHLSFRFSACCRCWRWRTRGGIERNQGNDRTRERANISVFENDGRSKNRGENGEKPTRGEIPDNRSVVPLVVES